MEEQRKKKERDMAKRMAAEHQIKKLAKEHPDFLQEKATEMLLKIDAQKIQKSTKILAPLSISTSQLPG